LARCLFGRRRVGHDASLSKCQRGRAVWVVSARTGPTGAARKGQPERPPSLRAAYREGFRRRQRLAPTLWPVRAAVSAIAESGLALLGEGGHALLLVLEREHGMEHAALEAQPFGKRRLVGAVDRLLDHRHRRLRETGDLLCRLQRLVEKLG